MLDVLIDQGNFVRLTAGVLPDAVDSRPTPETAPVRRRVTARPQVGSLVTEQLMAFHMSSGDSRKPVVVNTAPVQVTQ